jgi:replication-associated recombination protein RarA
MLLKTANSYMFSEVASAFQKSIRRGLEEEALYWGTELDKSGYGEYAWKRMRIIVSEDIGLAEPVMPAVLWSLYQMWLAQRKKKDEKHNPERLFLVHGILLLVRAKKSRIVDHATITYYAGALPHQEIPDYAQGQAHDARASHGARGKTTFSRRGFSWQIRQIWKTSICNGPSKF